MSPLTKPTVFTTPFAANGEKTLPPLVQSAEGRASLNDGFPVETQLPIRAGGLPPMRADINGALNLTTGHDVFQLMGGRYTFEAAVAAAEGYPKGVELYFSNPAIPLKLRSLKDNNKDDFNGETGYIGESWAIVGPGLMPWNELFIFSPPCIAFGKDGKLYQCLQPNGPGTSGGVREPGDNQGYWERLIPDLSPSYDISNTLDYFLCWYPFKGIHPVAKPGMVPLNGYLASNAATLYPKAFAYLQTPEGQQICTTESAWQAAHVAKWAQLADGTQITWDNVGGVCKYVIDTAAGTIRMPDLRGMYDEVAGFDALGVGAVHGDVARRKIGTVGKILGSYPNGLYYSTITGGAGVSGNNDSTYISYSDNARVEPTGNSNKPRAWGALACCYLGAPAT